MTDHTGNSHSGGGLENLLALAHLAEQRSESEASASSASASSSSSRTASPADAAPSRRPPKKRETPDDLDAALDGPLPLAKRPRGPTRRLTIETSRPTQVAPRPRASSSAAAPSRTKRGGAFKMKANRPSFPVVLLAILSAERNREAIAFLSDGRSFVVVDPGGLARDVLPLHFEERVPTVEEFVHLLAIWGFESTKDPKYPQVDVYRHPLFRKGDWESCLKMTLPAPDALPPSPGARSVTPPALGGTPAMDGTRKFPPVEENALYQRLLRRDAAGLPSRQGPGMPAVHRRATLDALPTGWTSTGTALPFSHGICSNVARVHRQVPRRPTPSDAEVRATTTVVVSAALDALRRPSLNVAKTAPSAASFARSRRHTVDALPTNFAVSNAETARLDAMTDLFLERSRARLNTRPSIMGPRNAASLQKTVSMGPKLSETTMRETLVASVGAEVEAQASALVAARMQHRMMGRKVSLLGNWGGGM